jgi:hypothetical protein
MYIYKGFKASATNYDVGFNFVVDNTFKLVYHERIIDLFKSEGLTNFRQYTKANEAQQDIYKMTFEEHKGKAITTTHAGKKSYTIKGFLFNSCALTHTFTTKEQKTVTVADYLNKAYDVILDYPECPLVELMHKSI